jgi:two-component system, chemotaxis family, chemotaxis protein CheY
MTVDDAPAVRRLAQAALAPFDCDVREATNGFNALFAMEQALPDLLLLDVNMPTMGGAELLAMMRANHALRAIPVILLTSPADHNVLTKLTALGVSGQIMKPFSAAALLAKIHAVLALAPTPVTFKPA